MTNFTSKKYNYLFVRWRIIAYILKHRLQQEHRTDSASAGGNCWNTELMRDQMEEKQLNTELMLHQL